MFKKINHRKGQVAIWIILGAILVASALTFFFIGTKTNILKPVEGETAFDVQIYLQECVKADVEKTVDIILPQGGFIKPKSYVVFNKTNVSYLYYHAGYFEPGVAQNLILSDMKNEIKKSIEGKITSCINDMKRDFERQNSEIKFADSSPPVINLDWGPDVIFISIKKKMTITKQGETQNIENINLKIKSPAYNLASVAFEIGMQEAETCYFEYVGYTLIYPRYFVNKFQMSDSTEIYTIYDTKSKKTMNVAVRGCAISPGLP